jgi:PAZ domain.
MRPAGLHHPPIKVPDLNTWNSRLIHIILLFTSYYLVVEQPSQVQGKIAAQTGTGAAVVEERKEEREDGLATARMASSTNAPMEWSCPVAPWEIPSAQQQQGVYVPLLDYLCAYMHCSLKELQVLFSNLESRRRMLHHLRSLGPGGGLRTTHLQPVERNLQLHAHDLSAQNANLAFAFGGYLDITVRQYYYVKHARKLKHPYLPCLMEFGGAQHVSYYPLELLAVRVRPGEQKGMLDNIALRKFIMQMAHSTNETKSAFSHANPI